jgi:hypothetical protein
LFLTLLPRKLFVITIIIKALDFGFNHFFPGQFMDLQWSGRRGKVERRVFWFEK